MKYEHETLLRRATLGVALTCWAVSLVLSWLIIDKVIDQVNHPGIGLIVFMAQGLAITATIVWAQFRNRRVMVEVLRTGITLGRKQD